MTARPPMPDGNTAAELQHDRDESRREAALPTREAALDDLVDRLLDGEEYPRRATSQQINMLDILAEQDGYELAEMVNMFMHGDDLADKARGCVMDIVHRYLDGSKWLEMRRDEMATEAEEA